MNKKLLISLIVILSIVFSFSICFATDGLSDAANGVRNVVGGVENTVENAALDISNASKDATGDMENGVGRTTGTDSTDGSGGTGYDTMRTATVGDTTLMGMTSNGWTWLIIGIAAIAIIAIVWYYSMQFTTNNSHNNNNDRLD